MVRNSQLVDSTFDQTDQSAVQVALVSSIEAHPDSEKLFVCQVDMGAGTTCQVSILAPSVDPAYVFLPSPFPLVP